MWNYREMKDEKQAEIDRKRAITKERQTKQAEKLRLEEMAKRVRFSSRFVRRFLHSRCRAFADGSEEAATHGEASGSLEEGRSLGGSSGMGTMFEVCCKIWGCITAVSHHHTGSDPESARGF